MHPAGLTGRRPDGGEDRAADQHLHRGGSQGVGRQIEVMAEHRTEPPRGRRREYHQGVGEVGGALPVPGQDRHPGEADHEAEAGRPGDALVAEDP